MKASTLICQICKTVCCTYTTATVNATCQIYLKRLSEMHCLHFLREIHTRDYTVGRNYKFSPLVRPVVLITQTKHCWIMTVLLHSRERANKKKVSMLWIWSGTYRLWSLEKMFITCASEGYVKCWFVSKSQAECLIAHDYGPLACSKQIQNKYPLI